MKLIRRGEVDSPLVQADIEHWSHYRAGPCLTKNPIRDLRVVANLFRVSVHFVVRANSPIRTIYQLTGKRVSLGPEGAGTPENSRDILGVYGISEGDIQIQKLKPGAAADALKTDEIDTFIAVGAEPITAIANLIHQHTIATAIGHGPTW